VRIGHIGPTASPEQILPTLDALEQVLGTADGGAKAGS